MRRHINLVNPALLPPKPFFQFNSMMTALGVLCLGLLLLSLFIESRVAIYTASAAQAQSRAASRQTDAKRQKDQIVPRKKDDSLDSILKEVQARADNLNRVAHSLDNGGNLAGGTRTPSDYLYALAQQPLTGVWLTNIEIDGRGVSLEGRTSHPEALPATLDKLNGLSAFHGMRFAALDLGRETLNPPAKATDAPASTDAAKLEVTHFRVGSPAGKEGRQ